MSFVASFLDSAMDALVVPGFSRVGYAIRSRSFESLDRMSLVGKTVVVTGHTSGLGYAAACQLRSMGADLVVVGRHRARSEEAAERIKKTNGVGTLEVSVADMGELGEVRELATWLGATHPRIDVVVHNAGALLKERTRTSVGHDTTLAVHVYGPFLLTHSLLASLAAANGRVITVSSGGMYATGLPDFDRGHGLELPDAKYDGTRQYAVAKRAQVTLNEMWASNAAARGVAFHAMHPGWADTPGVATSIPVFRAVTRPILRNAAQGADTISWLAGTEPSAIGSGGFWCDRAQRPIHRLGSTRRRDTPEARHRLWKLVNEAALGSFS
jgi:NAD(P)-dependent dehydrogenase (short-subunit alcohol dehydrogenase family)